MEKWPLVLYPPLQSPCVLCDSRAIYSSHSNRLWALPCDLIDFCCPPCCCLRSALSQLSTPSFHSFHSLPIHFYPFQSLKNMHHTPSTSATSASAFFSAPQSEAHTSWNADTGASAHITFNRHWIHNLKPYRVQISVEFVGPQQPNGEMAQWGNMPQRGNMAQRGNGPKGKVWVHTRK